MSGMLRRLGLAGLAAVILASCSSGKDTSSPEPTTPVLETPTTTPLPTTPVVARALAPERGSVQGVGGRGMVVVLDFTARDASALAAEFRIGGALPPPAAPAKPGRNPAFPGLVVGLSTTGTSLGGPTANLANLFQIVSPSRQLDGSMHVSAVWANSQADFGSDVDATLVAYAVAGTAPDVIPPSQANIDVISNTVEVAFRISSMTGPAAAAAPAAADPAAAAPPATTSVPGATTVRGATTTSVRPAEATPTTRPGTSTVAPAPASTTTRAPAPTLAPATTTTTKFLGLF